MKPTWCITVSFCLCTFLSSFLVAQDKPTSSAQTEKARVFITDSQSWEMAGGGGGSSAGFGGATRGGARPQTAEIIKTFGERCPAVMVNNIQQKADYIVLLDHEGGKGFLRHRNKVAVFARVSGDSIVSKSTLSLGGSVQEACEAIAKDWSAHGAAIRTGAADTVLPTEKPALVPAAQSEKAATTKISIASNPSAADIEIDGSFAGNTPSAIELPTGEHTVSISKAGFKIWERKVKLSGGTININAELESK